MIPVSLRHFRTPNTNLYLNGPILQIVDQPQSKTVSAGSTVVISGFATATFDQNPTAVLDGTITYQWYGPGGTVLVEGSKFVGTATSQLTINNPLTTDTGDTFYYEVGYTPGPRTGNPLNGDVKSNNSILTVLPTITITEDPVDKEAAIGVAVTFGGAASISPGYDISDLSYYWTVDGVVQPNTNSKVVTLSGISSGTQEVRFNATTTITSENDGQTVTNTITATSDPANFVTLPEPRSILRFEAFNSIDAKYAFVDVNFDEVDEFVLNDSVFGSEYDTVTYYAREKDLDLQMTMEAAAGGPPSPTPTLMIGAITANVHGEGGVSTVQLVHTKNVEHTVLGTTNNKAIFLYRGSNLLAVAGQGGQQGGDTAIPLAGGAGGGVNVAGQGGVGARNAVQRADTPRPDPGSLTLNGIFGSIITNTELQPGDGIAPFNPLFGNLSIVGATPDNTAGGRTISCTKGKYWLDKGLSPCENNSNTPIKFFTQSGVAIGNSIIRGYKPGYNIIQTEGRGWNNPPQAYVQGIGGNGGRGAIGGDGGGQQNRNRRDGAGGSGGSGYTDGTVKIISTQLGGNKQAKGVVRFKLTPPEPPVFTGTVTHGFNNATNQDTFLSFDGAVVNVQPQSRSAPDRQTGTTTNLKHYLVTMNFVYSSISVAVLQDNTAGGGSGRGLSVAKIEQVNSLNWRIWFRKGNGFNTFARNWSVTGTI